MDKSDYKSTVFLPVNVLSIRANLPVTEPEILARWEQEDIYGQLREARKGAPRFLLHDGPPYANGNLHMGHALNKVLKDLVVRSHFMLGYDTPFTPGWDCHGLPIEWAVLKEYEANGVNKNDVDPVQFRADCRKYAAGWVDVQREQFKRLGVLADWSNPYLTMNYESEAAILAELYKFAAKGMLYQSAHPVMWSPAERTGLADSDVEYKEVTSTQVDVGFKIHHSHPLAGTFVVVWTTTPWTLPANRALAFNSAIEYGLYGDGERNFLLADKLANEFAKRSGLTLKRDRGVHFSEFADAKCNHPMVGGGGFYTEPRPLLNGTFVTEEQGTGFVHMAPDHGQEDFELCKQHGIKPRYAVGPDGRYPEQWPWLGLEGSVTSAKFNAPDGPVCEGLRKYTDCLFAASHDFKHKYPFSDRSGAKLIMRATPQWFIDLDLGVEGIRDRALGEIEKTAWYPAKAKNRISSMVESRPPWLVSRQRLWGVPIALYVNKGLGSYLYDEDVNERILAAFREKGADAWYDADHAALLGSKYDLADYEPATDVLDVWFDSGSTHAYVLDGEQADLYLEGSDQHRGWFQASLLESCGTTGHAPFKSVLTHGFALDHKGNKMSKSKGNVVDPLAEVVKCGADVLRLWVAMTDSSEDVKVGKQVLEGTLETYKKFRNTLRYMAGALHGADFTNRSLDFRTYPPLERYMLSRLSTLNKSLPDKLKAYDFNSYVRELFRFCDDELSSFYFDIRKDTLYCDPKDSHVRQCYLTVLNMLFRAVVNWLKPVLVFTAEEAWQASGKTRSVHLELAPGVVGFQDEDLEKQWAVAKHYRNRVNEQVDVLVKAGGLKGPGDTHLTLRVPPSDLAALEATDFRSVAKVAELDLDLDVQVVASVYLKCERCWQREASVKEPTMLCTRCVEVLKK